jgi:hypothetical protein
MLVTHGFRGKIVHSNDIFKRTLRVYIVILLNLKFAINENGFFCPKTYRPS